MKRVVPAFLFLLLVPVLALAKQASDPWNNLKKLAKGQPIHVVLNDGKSYSGQFQSVRDDGLLFRVGGEEQTVPRQDILRVSAKRASHRLRNALIGAGIGAAVGIAWGVGCDYREVFGCGAPAAALGAGTFGPLGLGAGALIPTGGWHDVYRAR